MRTGIETGATSTGQEKHWQKALKNMAHLSRQQGTLSRPERLTIMTDLAVDVGQQGSRYFIRKYSKGFNPLCRAMKKASYK